MCFWTWILLILKNFYKVLWLSKKRLFSHLHFSLNEILSKISNSWIICSIPLELSKHLVTILELEYLTNSWFKTIVFYLRILWKRKGKCFYSLILTLSGMSDNTAVTEIWSESVEWRVKVNCQHFSWWSRGTSH